MGDGRGKHLLRLTTAPATSNPGVRALLFMRSAYALGSKPRSTPQ